MPDPAQILSEALRLPPAARATLVGRLLDSLDSEIDEDAERAWEAEISRRLAEIDTLSVHTLPWSEVRRRILTRKDDQGSR